MLMLLKNFSTKAMKFFVLRFLLSFCFATSSIHGALNGEELIPLKEPPGDVCGGRQRMEVLPGRGWDNLRHKDMGQVLDITYDKCKTTEDRLYLLPDNVHASPIKESDLQLTSEFIEHWSSYTSVTAKSFQLNIGANVGDWGISGSFSTGYQTMKQHQIDDKSKTTRIQLRTSMYNVHASPASQIDPDLKKLFLQALHELQNENTEKVDLLLELIVRDYGTHYITQAEGGAVLYQEDFISSTFVSDTALNKSQFTAAAGASFLDKFDFGAKYQQSVDSKFASGYASSRTSSSVKAIGGTTLTPNLTIDEWVKNLGNNLVMTDRYGSPLSYLITSEKFENISMFWLGRLRQEVDDAITRYYSWNVHVGCMNMDSPNFDYTANKDDSSCKGKNNNYTFGGVFQTCASTQTAVGDLCVDLELEHKNYLTGGLTCPENFMKILLHTGTASKSNSSHDCHAVCYWYWLWLKCQDECSDNVHKSAATYDSYWCADLGTVPNNTGYMFAGLYTDAVNNPFTSSQSCPPSYTAIKLGKNLKICAGDDYEVGYKYSVPFAGLFSCTQGNPLANKNSKTPPKTCPDGYSQHLATIDDDCEIHYCIKTDSFGKHGLTAVTRPPFTDISRMYMNTTAILKTRPAKPYVFESISGGSIAGIVIACIVGLLSPIAFFILYRRRRRVTNVNNTSETADQEPLLDNEAEDNTNTYGSINNSNPSEDAIVAIN